MDLEELTQRVAVSLAARQTSAAVDRALDLHRLKHKDSPIFDFFPFHPNSGSAPRPKPRSFAILYAVEGAMDDVTGDSSIFILDGTTREAFRAHVALQRPLTFVILTPSSSLSSSGASPLSTVVEAEDVRGDAAVSIELTRVDVLPSSAALPSYRGAATILSRPSTALDAARHILDALERGSGQVTAEQGLTHCCQWLEDTLRLVDDQFRSLIQHASHGLQLLEAFMKRYTAYSQVWGLVNQPSGAFQKLLELSRETDEATLQYRQRVARLALQLSVVRLDALWASVLSKEALTLHLLAPEQHQSLDGVVTVVPHIMKLLSFVFVAASAANPNSAAAASSGGANAAASVLTDTLRLRFVPLLAASLTEKLRRYLGLEKMFSVESVPDASEQQGYLMPLCTRPAVAAKLDRAAEACMALALVYHLFGRALETCYPSQPFLFETFRRLPSAFDRTAEMDTDNSPDDITFACPLHYAASRCRDLKQMIVDIDETGCGMMTKEVRCLFDTLHLAATTFAMLDGAAHKNWQLFFDTFYKTRTLKFITVEPVAYASSTLTSLAPTWSDADQTRQLVAAAGAGDDGSDEEKRILRSRVAVLTSELSEARELLSKAMAEVSGLRHALHEASDYNVILMQQLGVLQQQQQRAVSSLGGCNDSATMRNAYGDNHHVHPADVSYATLIAALAEAGEGDDPTTAAVIHGDNVQPF